MNRSIVRILSWTSLALLALQPVLYLAGSAGLASVKLWMLVMTLVWFVTTPFWMWTADEAHTKGA